MPLLLLKDIPKYECLLEASLEVPELDPSATEVFLNLLRAGDQAFRLVDVHLVDHGISQGRFGVLMALWANRRSSASLRPAEIAARTGVTRATVSGLVDTLERAGLVARLPDQADRRMLSVCLTPKGRQRLRQVLPEHFRRMAWLMQPLSERDRRTFVRLFSKVLARAATLRPSKLRRPRTRAATGRAFTG